MPAEGAIPASDEPCEEPVAKRLKLDEDGETALALADKAQAEINEVTAEFHREILELQSKYSKKKKPLYKKRAEHLAQIPNFWMTAIENHPILGELLVDIDLAVLKHLTDLAVDDTEKNTIVLTMEFSENPFFSNSKLEKRVVYSDPTDPESQSHTSCTKVDWKPGKETEVMDSGNFFAWFITTEVIHDSTDEVADQFRDSLWPEALLSFKGELEVFAGDDTLDDSEDGGVDSVDEDEEGGGDDADDGDEEEDEDED